MIIFKILIKGNCIYGDKVCILKKKQLLNF